MAPPLMTIASVGLPLLQKLGESRDVRRYKQQLEQQQKTANLINALSRGRIQIQPTAEYKPSAFTQLAGAASTGLGAYNTFRDLTAKRAAQGVAQQLSEAELAKLQREASKERGIADYAQGIGRQVEEAKRLAPGGAGPSLGQFPTFGGEAQENVPLDQRGGATPAPSMLEQMGRLDPFRVMGQQQAARTASQQAAEDRAAEFERETRRMTAKAAQTRAQAAALAAITPPGPKKLTIQDKKYYKDVAGDLGSLVPHIPTFEDFKGHPSFAGIEDDTLLRQMYSSYSIGARDRREALGKVANERIEEFTKAARAQQAVKDRFDIRRSLTEIVDGIIVGGGISDIGVLKALAKMQDPGSVVRQEEFETIAEGIAAFDRGQIKVGGFFTGMKLNDKGRREILELAYASYNQRKNDIDTVLDNLVSDYSTRPGMVEGIEKSMWTAAGLTYRLPDVAEMVTDQRMGQLQARVGGKFRTDLDDISSFIVSSEDVDRQAAEYDAEWQRIQREKTGR